MSQKPSVFSVLGAPVRSVEFKSTSNMNVLIVILALFLTTSKCCEQTCYSAYKGGSLDLQEVQDGSPTIVPINFTGVVTIEAAYIPGYKAQWEYIRFMQNEDVHPLVLQFYTPQKGYITTLNIFAEDDTGRKSSTGYSAYSLFNKVRADIIIQVSDIHVTKDNFYRIYLGEPGNGHASNYSYQSEENWEELSFMRFNTTTQIKTDNRAIYFKSVSVCSDDTPVLCGGSVETVAVSRGAAFNLSCSVYGAPYLEAEWSNEGNIRKKPVYSVDGFLKTTTIPIQSYNGYQMGMWTCRWRNKNFGTFSETKTFHVIELVSKPSQTIYFVHTEEEEEQAFKWIIRNKRPQDLPDKYTVLLECEQGNLEITPDSKDSFWISMLTYFEEYSGVSEHSATLKLPKDVTSDFITCTLSLVENSGENGTEILGVLDTTTLYREGYHCEAGEYGVGEECVKCEDSFTSDPRSITCFPLELPEELQIISPEEKKEWETSFSTNINVQIGVVIGIILLLTLAVSAVALTIFVSKKLACL